VRNSIIQGDMRQVLSEMPENSVDMCVTSPPYWGLRAYAGETEAVWGGDAECEHVWGDYIPIKAQSRWHVFDEYNTDGKPRVGIGKQDAGKDGTHGAYCQLCGAWYGELGREPTPELYVEHIVECFRAVRRVLKPWSVLLLNLGASYAGSGGDHKPHHRNTAGFQHKNEQRELSKGRAAIPVTGSYKPLDLIPIPWLVALALQKDGWYLRRDAIWEKPSPMPESLNTWRWERHRVKVEGLRDFAPSEDNEDRADGGVYASGGVANNPYARYEDCLGCPRCEKHNGYVFRYGNWRPTTAHEYVFLLAPGVPYYCDAEGVRQEAKYGRREWIGDASDVYNHIERQHYTVTGGDPSMGANLRSVWRLPTARTSAEHFAAFSIELADLCVRMGTSPKGYCAECGRPWVRVVDVQRPDDYDPSVVDEKVQEGWGGPEFSTNRPLSKIFQDSLGSSKNTLDWWPSCDCDAEHDWDHDLGPVPVPCEGFSTFLACKRCDERWYAEQDEPKGCYVPGLVLDPFIGTGTTAVAAKANGRDYLGIDISEEYCAMARNEIRKGIQSFRKPKKPLEVKVGDLTYKEVELW
jgi:DNA modification methylase